MFGREAGESDAAYRARVVPLIKTALAMPRERLAAQRKDVEARAHVTPAQSRALDDVFDKVYDDALAMTNQAVADGQLSPYERNVAGWLGYAGGLGTLLEDAQGQIAQVLSPDQLRTIGDSGFEWSEYLGVQAPWEELTPPPPPP